MATQTRRRFSGPQAIDSPVFAGLVAEWGSVAASRQFRTRLREWATAHPALDYPEGTHLLDAALNGDDETRCAILEALAKLAPVDELAMRTAIQALLPRLVYLVNRTNRSPIDIDDRAATVMVIAHETLVGCQPGTAGTQYDLRIWSNIRKRFIRHLDAVDRSLDAESERFGLMAVSGGDQTDSHSWTALDSAMQSALAHEPESISNAMELAELCDWVAARARIDLGTARLVVLTRAGGVPVEDLIGSEGASSQSIRRRRLRAEKRLATALAVA